MGHFFCVSSGQSSCFAWLRVRIWLSPGPPTCVRASLSQDGFQRRGLWVGWHHSFFDLPGAFLRVCSREGLLRVRSVWSLSLFWAGLSSSGACCFGVSVRKGQTPAAQPGAHLPPASVPEEQAQEKGTGEWAGLSPPSTPRCAARVLSACDDATFTDATLAA